jgi:leucyl-tRNA synthetase
LENEEREEMSEEEKEKHEIVWYPFDKLPALKMTCAEKDIWLDGINGKQWHSEKGILVNSGEFTGLSCDEAAAKIVAKVDGQITKTYRLRDWLISRQRYWGCPIPVIHCAKCGAVPVPEKDLPVVLPELENFTPRDDGKSPLAKAAAWMNVPCPQCGAPAERESDTLDTFIDSSWYFLRYTDPKNATKFADADKIASWMPVAFYSGGAEHTTMHLLFARFFQKVLFDLGLVKDVEPFKHRLNRSLILGPDGNKMSKSKGNVIDPDELVERLGADTVRLYLAFIGPYNETSSYPWDPNGVVGVRRFLERVWRISEKLSDTTDAEVLKQLHKVIKRVGEEVQQLKFNAAIAQFMAFCNLIEKKGIARAEFGMFVKMLSIVAPHIAEELWATIGNTTLVTDEKWPAFDPALIIDETVKVTVQINGKVRATIEVTPDISEAEITEKILALADVQKWVNGASIKKTIYVKGKIFSIVL